MTSQDAQIRIGLIHRAYSAVVTLALPLIALGLLCSPRGRRRFPERFGFWPHVDDIDWWFHGASVGEVQGLLPLIKTIRDKEQSTRMFLSASSPTGLERGASSVEQCSLLPLDAPVLVDRALRTVSFKRFVLSETELWPNAIHTILGRGVPCHIVNGRISDYTLEWYKRLRSVFGPLLRGFCTISVPDEEQRDRFIALGASPGSVYVTGHTKYDTNPKFANEGARQELREELFPGIKESEPLVTLGSIREGEEGIWFEALARLWQAGSSVRVIVAPRHAERYEYFASAMSLFSDGFTRWTSRQAVRTSSPKALLLDSMGVLENAYAASDLAFVGATLVDIGGHNPFEPAMYGVPIVVGPYTSVIREPISQLRAQNAVAEISTVEEVSNLLVRLSRNDRQLIDAGKKAYQVWSTHRGSAVRALEVVRQGEGRR